MSETKGFRPYLNAARRNVTSVEPEQVMGLLVDENVVFLDVRQSEEYSAGAIRKAIHIPRGVLEEAVEERIPRKDAAVIVYCASGVRSVLAARTLASLDYTNVVSMAGGFNTWKDQGRPWEQPVIEQPTTGTYTEQFLARE